jgi:PAS domain S-box-containing protein
LDLKVNDVEKIRLLEESEGKYRAMFEQAVNSIVLYDAKTRKAVEFNDTAHESLGYTREEFKELRIEDYEAEKSGEEVQAQIQEFCLKGEHSFETRHRRKNGEIRDILVNCRFIRIHDREYLLAFFTDITMQKRNEAERIWLEKKLRQTQKIESIGTLAGGIAHDFNNILSIIQGYAELSLMDITESMKQTRENLSQLVQAVRRAKKLVRQILTFSRKVEETRKPVVVNSIVKESLSMLRSTLPTTIDIRRDIDDEPFVILGDATQVHQIMVNLCTNSTQAIAGKPGIITVKVKRVEQREEDIDTDFAAANIANIIKPGSYVQITVSDTGCGMTPEVLERVFDPYFTTKEEKQGTGLGLAVVEGIVRNYQGHINIDSKPGQGTHVNILIPLADPSEYPEKNPEETIPTEDDTIVF